MIKKIKKKFFSKNNGFSKGIYKSLNCGLRSKDKPKLIKANIQEAINKFSKNKKTLILPKQSHSNKCLIAKNIMKIYDCDGLVSNKSNVILGIITADCLPIIFIDHKKMVFGICHAGWRGLLKGIIQNTIKKMNQLNSQNSDISAYIGPCIRRMSYEVSKSFVRSLEPKYQIFAYQKYNKYYYDLPKLAKFILSETGVLLINDSKKNTFVDTNYFSYRESKKRNYSDYGRNISMVSLN